MRPLAILIISLVTLVTYGQEIAPAFDGHHWEAPYHLPVPEEWTIERFLIHISFAPQIPYKGIEDIRFSPGWVKATSDEYWSYAFLWYLDGKVMMNAGVIEKNLEDYYTGLVTVNGSNIPSEKVIPVMTAFRKGKKLKGDVKTYIGTIMMMDYIQQKPITLHCKVHTKSCAGDNHTFMFFELSPQPLVHDVWKSLDQLCEEFRCNKN